MDNFLNEYFEKISELNIELNVFFKLIVCTKNMNMDHIYNSKDATMSKLYIIRHDIRKTFTLADFGPIIFYSKARNSRHIKFCDKTA